MTIQHSASNSHRSGLILDTSTSAMAFTLDIIYLKAEEKTFVATRQALVGHSPVFEDMFLVGNSSSGEGRSVESPIVLEGYKAADFEALLMVLFPTPENVVAGKFTLTKEQWVGVLRITKPWGMEKIRKIAIKALSEESFGLTAVDKIALGLDHKVVSWLLEGLTTVVSKVHEFPVDGLEEAVGLRTAYRIAGVRSKTNSGAATTSITVGGNQCAAFPLTAIHCGFCCKLVVMGGLGCQSCSKTLGNDILGAIYMSPTADTSKVSLNSTVGGHCFYLQAQNINCTLCHRPAIPHGITCPSCSNHHLNTTNIYLSLCPPSPSQTVPSTEDLVREVFKNAIEECGPQ
ncbi:hypothetical protein FA13DRAFT_1690812 [Coprinellus micaceus]|uniref:BTB domain-containing protein n=1 Tax=Coprinellus micaceus TaxID=71717 RepID=A0A4Y7T1Z5_COPMI|nr:hypothetical protein FA13DRAFT_1690812 [Coprinellus micaceus]